MKRRAQLVLIYHHHHTEAGVERLREFGLEMGFRVSISE